MLEQFAAFAREMPAWCDTQGMPLSWRHFVYGMSHIGRAHAQEELMHANATRIASQGTDDTYRKYLNDLRTAAGFTRS